MAAAYRVVVSSVSCYNSVVVDRRTHSHAVHYCSGPCGALSQGLDCTVAHRGTCSELLVAPDPVYTDTNSSPIHSRNMITQQLPNHGKISVTMDTSYNGCLERAGSSGNLSLVEDSPTWRGKKTPSCGGSTGNLSSAGSLKDITEEAINLASGKLKEFSFDKLRLSSSSHVTFRKGRKVRPDSFSRRSTDLEIIYGHFSSNITTNGTSNGMINGTATCNDENIPPFVLGKGAGLEETKLKGNSGTLSAITKVGGGSTSSLTNFGSLDQSLNTVASLYRNTLGEENLIARLLEKTRAEAGAGGAGGEDIRACLDILLKCSEDLKKCTDIIKQCIRRKAGGGPEDGGASPDSMYRAVMTRLSSYLKRLPLELEGIGGLGGSGQGGQGAPGSGHSDLAELVNTLHSIQQGPYSPIFGNEQPPRYEDVVQSSPIPKTVPHSASCSHSSLSSSSTLSLKSDSIHTKPVQSSPPRTSFLTNGLQHLHSFSIAQHTLSPPSVTCSASSSSPTQSPSPLHTSPTPPYTHTPPASPMEALYIEEEEADVGKTLEQISQQTLTPTRGVNTVQNKNGTVLSQHMDTLHNTSNTLPANTGYSPTWPSSAPLTVSAPKTVSHRNDDIDKLLMDLENLSQSMSHPRNTEPPLPAKTRRREGGQGISNEALTQPKIAQFQVQQQASHLTINGPSSRTPPSLTPPQGENSEASVGEEEDGALLLRILESIESFAQELVDHGAGSTGSAERKCGKEREVMRLLQDTLATTGRADTPLESTNPPAAAPTAPSMHTNAVPAIPPKNSLANTLAVSPTTSESVCNATCEPAHKPTPDVAPKPLPTPIPEPTTEATDTATESSTGDISAPVKSSPASLYSTTHSIDLTPVAAPEAPAPVAIPATEATRESAIAVGDPAAVRDTVSTLLIQQTPEVIRVQSKPDKKPGTPPPAPAPVPATPVPTPRSPSPPAAPVIVTPPPPAINIPRFYYPRGLPALGKAANHDEAIAAIETAFTEFEEEKADIYEMGKIAKASGCPLYWKAPMFYAAGGERTGFVSVHSFIATWRKLLHSCHDDASRFIYLLAKPGCNYLEQEDFIPLLQDIVDTHPGLTFLKDAPEFHSRYITTVIQRIYYVVNRSWTGRLTMMELRRSNFLQTLALLEEEDDINQITDYFSYEHFYVIYCKFWELDTDHDLYIDPKDLARYNDHASSNRIIERLFSGAVTRGNAVQREGRMSYAEFVWFLISEEDKKNPTSIEYWFRCMDVDGDGVLSMFELEYFYEEQCERMERMGIEPLPFQDLLCQMLDLVKPESSGKITLGDLKRCRMAHIFFDTFFNLEKYLDHEQRDPFAVQKDIDSDGPEPSDWDKYASEEYEILVAEETANEQLHEGSFDDDYESEELQVPGEIGNKMEKLVISDLSA
ncbi:serine/threonine-protein phosphatase 2A regulatory subunit B'' subunit alpha isoform X1 [Xiphias gladius]|uniref:serine/threonine-protein phosphatase 2A regulatory subunit B'' subunit alpha isoform X1 n=1 Tax=Xiphias gladius TaxID=8245 RepID=UPI001A98B748|nr:serine/threonine-protein phosphatase 2A regulatory subunit B'' subunit alpha isoform X1 [Xiphias gladius]XP_039993417.1 serine/threonine-protein phosphatase 2A regulatory subunit B'' subunit alpha isoform X1 [Xiphias gladius]XP_039993418.1 serine/threonine-protein phosphatase 2A regulatory subunit B'' subunit alpha isoform X1 [Xiphias gladius]XP_039993419.1 serine/threonine-protein phosphatase 2A regulatory subunit B'' subunit alpha isoform X1 [Xiphias gladius]XP_039993420.1 serine/threonine